VRRLAVLFLASAAVACGGLTDDAPAVPAAPPQVPSAAPEGPCPPLYRYEEGFCVVREVYVPGGTFTMGRGRCEAPDPVAEPLGECVLRDSPVQVTVAPFYVDVAPVLTQKFACNSPAKKCEVEGPVDGYPSSFRASDMTLEIGTSTNQIDSVNKFYCGPEGKRLIREDEWEFVVTAAGTRLYPWGDDPPSCKHLWFDRSCPPPPGSKNTSVQFFMPLGAYPPSAEGLYDLVNFLPHLVAPSPQVYGPSYDPSPVKKVFPLDCPKGTTDPACVYQPGYCKEQHVYDQPPGTKPKPPTECSQVDWAVRGGRAFGVVGPVAVDRPVSALRGTERLLSFRDRVYLRCVRDAP